MLKKKYLRLLFLFFSIHIAAQQDPQYTQYMYNTMSVNAAYAGSRGMFSVTGIHRSQWVGVPGAPRTQTLGIETPIGKAIGLGFSVVNDQIGPSDEFFADINFSYSVKTSETQKLAFGLKAGARIFNLDWSRGTMQDPDAIFQQNVDDRLLPTIGAGVYLYSSKSYLGLSIPNFFTNQHYDDIKQALATERLHFYLIAGYVMDLSQKIKFKPAFLFKHVAGAPVIVDLSANFMFYDKLRLGAAYRWDDSFAAMAGFQITRGLLIGYAYDYTSTEIQRFTDGTHEIMVRFDMIPATHILKSPRFF